MSYSGELRRQITFAVLKQGEAVSHVAQKYNVARKTIYFWIKRYQQAPLRNKTKALESRYVSGKNHPRAQAHRARPTLIRLVVLHPDWGCRKLSLALKKKGIDIGYFGVNRLLTRLEAGTLEQRQNFSRNYSGPGRLKADIKLEVIRKVLEERKSISKLASEYAVARKSIHQWLARYQEAKERGISGAVALKESYVTAQKHPRAIYPKITAELLSLIAQNPELSVHKLAKLVPASSWTVWSILNRNNLNLYQQRVAFAQSQRQVQVPVFSWLLDRIRLVWETFVPSVAPAPPPFAAGQAPQRMYRMVRPFLLSLVTSSLFSLGFIWWINLLASQPFGTSIGLLFATVALFFGSFFFAYSMKYYFTLAIVLSFSQQSGANGSPQLVNGKRRNLLSWILGLNGNGSVKQNGRLLPAGLEPSLEHITLKRKPFISVHIPFYNEKNVAERILAAVTAFDWANYEVIVVDDSTDETTEIAKRFLRDNYGSLRIIKVNEGEIFKTSSIPNKPSFTLIHRTSRSGFKGGALREALRVSDPKAEFIVIFDADFVPYPDTLELFLKYFQVAAGSLDFKKVTSDQWLVTSEGKQNKSTNHQPPITNHSSNIAAVQGYQWHVLNKSENWITRGVRSEYSGSYVIERSGQEILGALKMISGSVYMIRKDVLEEVGWETSITEDFELTLKLYEKGYKVVYTPYIQAPAECVSTLKRLVRQRMRWAEGHSHNIRRMFIRLLFGKWEDLKIDDRNWKVDLEARSSKMDNQPSTIQPQNQTSTFYPLPSKRFIPSPLTLMEKLEFLYLSPYYLQAFLFLVGTISWLISETVFAARLPFWTSLWGWSLVLTNFLALPLLNGVGLFLEEAEERDFVGLLSFIALSYIVVPFQAYAAVKGFLEKEEGPWFRTPKTGHITDIITRGRFFRFIAGILPGRAAPSVTHSIVNNETMKQFSNSYLALATANNSFNSFTIRPRQARWLGRLVVVVILIASLTLVSLSPLVQTKTTQEALRPGFRVPELTSKKHDFRFDEEPEFIVDTKEEVERSVSFVSETYAAEELENEVYYGGEKVEVPIEANKLSDGKILIKIKTNPELKPGRYELKTELGEGETRMVATRDFTWGVLVINTNKSIYLPGDRAYIQMGALDDAGHTVCDANLELKVSAKGGSAARPKLKIEKSGKCGPESVTDVPDYFAYWQVEQPGTYEMVLANLDNGYSIADSFEVRESVPFDIERTGPTRIYPPATYKMTLKIKANQDFAGEVIERVPASFEILTPGSVSNNQNEKNIVWKVDWGRGESYPLSYTFDAPDVSPQFYLLGPLRLSLPRAESRGSEQALFQEARRWQIAADALVTIDAAVDITSAQHNGSSPTTVFTSDQIGYAFYVDSTNTCVYSKTTNGGASWGAAVTVDAQTDCVMIAVWYDRWTPGDDTGNLIHIATIDIGDDDIWYRQLDTSSDTLSGAGPINITLGSSYAGLLANGTNIASITKSTTGVLYAAVLDTSDSIVVKCSSTCTTAANWSESSPTFTLGDDWPILVPLLSGNIMLIQWDISATTNDIQSKVYNGTSWDAGWTNIATALDNATYDAAFGATVDRATGNVYLVYAASIATLGTDDDIRTAIYSAGSWTLKTDVVTNSACAGVATCGITGAKIARDETTGDIYVLYSARTTAATAATGEVYWKKSADGMTSWGAEQGPINGLADDIYGARLSILGARIYATWYGAAPDDLFGNTVYPPPSAFNQAAYRWFENNNSTAVGPPLAAQDTAATAPNQGTPFRLRGLIDISGGNFAAQGQSFKLQFAQKSGSCDADFVGESYSDVSPTSGTIRFYDNSVPADGATAASNANDPTYLGHTRIMERYEEANPTDNVAAIPTGQAGLWDFSLVDNSALANTPFCFRIKKSGTYTADAKVVKDVTVGTGWGYLNYGTWDGTYYWIGHYYNKLYKIDPAGTVVNEYILAADIRPLELEWDGTYIWVASADTYGKLVKFDPSTGLTVATYTKNPTGLGSGGVQGVIYDGTNLWIGVAQEGGGAGSGFVAKLSLADPDTNICTATSITDVNGLTHSGSYVWAAANTNGNFVAKIAKSDCSKTTYATGTNPVRVDNDGTYVYIAHWGSDNVYKLLMSDGSNQGTFTTCDAPNTVRLDNAGNFWTACDDGKVMVHTSAGVVLDSLTPGVPGDNINGLIFDGDYMWVNNWQTTHVYKMNTGEMLDTYTSAAIPEIVTVPEYIWLFFGLGPILPALVGRLRRRLSLAKAL